MDVSSRNEDQVPCKSGAIIVWHDQKFFFFFFFFFSEAEEEGYICMKGLNLVLENSAPTGLEVLRFLFSFGGIVMEMNWH